MKNPWSVLERNLHFHLVAGLLWKMRLEEVLAKHHRETVPTRECLYDHRKYRLSLSVYVDDKKRLGRDNMWDHCGQIFGKRHRPEHPILFIKSIWVVLTEQQRVIMKQFNPGRILFRRLTTNDVTNRKTSSPQITTWGYDMEDHAEEWIDAGGNALHGLSSIPPPEDFNGTGEGALIGSHVALTCLYLARIGRPHSIWTANLLARSVTKRYEARDEMLAR